MFEPGADMFEGVAQDLVMVEGEPWCGVDRLPVGVGRVGACLGLWQVGEQAQMGDGDDATVGIAVARSVSLELFEVAGAGSNSGFFVKLAAGSGKEVFVIVVDESPRQCMLLFERRFGTPDQQGVEFAVANGEDDQIDCDVHRCHSSPERVAYWWWPNAGRSAETVGVTCTRSRIRSAAARMSLVVTTSVLSDQESVLPVMSWAPVRPGLPGGIGEPRGRTGGLWSRAACQ